MRGRFARLAAALVASLLLSACAGLVTADPATLVLRAADLPQGFVQAAAGPYTNAEVAQRFGVPPDQVEGRLGRVRGYRSVFVRQGPVSAGAVEISSVASVYKGAVAARQGLTFEVEVNRRLHPDLRQLADPRVGDQALAFVWPWTDPQTHARLESLTVFWRRANVLGALSVLGVPGTLSVDEAVRLARIVDARCKAAA
jgi:hypothetical protein